MYDRPLTRRDILDIAAYLIGTDQQLDIAMSELGFDSRRYGKQLRRWLRDEANLTRVDGIWRQA